jgi:hypothetical protein
LKDRTGQILTIGDRVVFTPPGYRGLEIGTITWFTPKKIRIEFNNTWNYGKDGHIQDTLISPSQVVKMAVLLDTPTGPAFMV